MSVVQEFTFEAGAEAERLNRAFDAFGVVVVKGLMAKDKLAEQRAAVNRLLAIRLERLGLSPVGDDIDDNLNGPGERRSTSRHGHHPGDQGFTVLLRHPGRHQLHEVSRACLKCDTLLSIHDIAQFRIDPPNHDERNFEWHQDFQYNVMSMNSATIWYPLKRVSEEMGPLVVVPGSHRTIVPVEMNFEGHKPGSGLMHTVLRFNVDEYEAERKAAVLCPVEEGDVVVFHSLMLHRSSANRSKRSRWTVNPRFGDAADPAFADRGWLAVRDRTQTAFAQYYPQYVKVSRS